MKSIIFFIKLIAIISLIYGVNSVNAQDRSGLKLSIGHAQMRVTPATYYLHYVDDSPSRDNLSTSRVLEPQSGSFTGHLAFWGKRDDIHIELGMLMVINQASLFAFDLGGGYNLLHIDDRIQAGVELFIGGGSKSIDMGRIENNDLYIQINGDQFYQDHLDVSLVQAEFFTRPGLFGSYDLTSNISLVVELGYNIKIAGSTPKVSFSGETLGDNPTSAAESFNDPNVSLQSYSDFGINTLQKLPVRVRGMQTRIGVIYYLK